MSRSKNPTRYPHFCFAVADRLERIPSKPYEMPCESLKEARGMALTFNCWKGAALDAGLDTRFSTVKDMIARVKEDPINGIRCEFLNQNIDPAIARWNKQLGIEDVLPDDQTDLPAYMRK